MLHRIHSCAVILQCIVLHTEVGLGDRHTIKSFHYDLVYQFTLQPIMLPSLTFGKLDLYKTENITDTAKASKGLAHLVVRGHHPLSIHSTPIKKMVET